MTPRLRHLSALNWILLFEFPNEALSSTVLSVCVCVFLFFINHCIALSLCNYNIYLHARHPETPVTFEVVMTTARCTQTCFHTAGTHVVLQPQGECSASEGSSVEEGLIVLNNLTTLTNCTRMHRGMHRKMCSVFSKQTKPYKEQCSK